MTKDEFMEEIFSIAPKGNPKTCYSEFQYSVFFRKMFNGDNVTEEIIKERFTQYIAQCISKGTEDKYIKTLENWMKAEDFNNTYKNTSAKKSPFRRK